MHPRLITPIVYLCVVGLLAAVYWAGLSGGFFFDDGANILVAPGVRLTSLTWEALQLAWASGSAGPLGRPVAMLTFALNYYLQGFNPFAFKLTNLVIHALSGVLVYWVSLRLLRDASPEMEEKRNRRFAAWSAAIWLLHPIQVFSVLYIVQRMTSLSALFLLVALCVHMRARATSGWRSMGMLILSWAVLWPVSVLCKETGLLFPAFVLAWEVLIRRYRAGRLDSLATVFVAVGAILLLAAGAYMLSPAAQWLWSGYALREFSLLERVYTEGRVLWFYIGLIVLPRISAFGLYHDDISLSTGLLSPWTTLPALLGLAALVVVMAWTRKRAPLVSFGVAWFLIGHAMESTVLPLEIAHEHRNYLPSLGLLWAMGHGLTLLWKGAAGLRGRYAIAGLALVYCAGITTMRAHQLGEPVRRTQMDAQYHPHSARSQYEAGATLIELNASTPALDQARVHFDAALTADPNFKRAFLGLVQLNCIKMQRAGATEVEALAKRLRGTPFAPADRNILYIIKEKMNARTLCLTRGEADGLFNAALENPTVSPSVAAILHSWHADYLWLNQRDIAAARAALARSLNLNPAQSSNGLKWAQLLFISGERADAGIALRALQRENLSLEERKTLDELLVAINIQTP